MKASLIASAFAAICVLQAASPTAAQTPTGPERGRAIYSAKGCYLCHGLAGNGALRYAPAIAGTKLSQAGIEAYVRKPRGVMPPYRQQILSDADLADVTAYVLSMKPGPPARDIPLLRPYVADAQPRQSSANRAKP